MELTAFQYADRKSLLYFPINFMEVSLLGFQAYRNLMCLPPDDTELLVRRLSVVEQNIIRHPSTCVNLNSIGAKRRRFDKYRRLTMQCRSDHHDQQYVIPSRINKLASIIPRWVRHENCLRNVLIGLCFIVSTILFNTCLVARNMKNPAHFVLSSAWRAETILSGLVGELRYWYNFEWVHGGGKILPPTHPTRIQVESIFGEIINALNVGLKLEGDKRMTTTVLLSAGDPSKIDSVSDMREEVFNRLANRYTSSHLEGHNWKLEVVDSRIAVAYYIRGLRRIVITTREIEYHCNSEADIAAILGHEVCYDGVVIYYTCFRTYMNYNV